MGKRWPRSYSSYEAAELRVLMFRSVKDYRRALGLFWTDPEIKGCPHRTSTGRELFVPEEAVALISGKPGIRIEQVAKVVSAGDLPADKVADIRREHRLPW